MVLNGLKRLLIKKIKRFQWRLKNKNNRTTLGRIPKSFDAVSVGDYSYGRINILSSSRTPKLLIGRFCSIAEGVTFVIQSGHYLDHLSTFPFKAVALNQPIVEATSRGGIVVEDDVWIGFGSTILDGVTLRRGTVVAAGAVVTKDTPPYSIVGGVPAKVIKYRFDPTTIQELCKIDFNRLSLSRIEEHIDSLYQPFNSKKLEEEFHFLVK